MRIKITDVAVEWTEKGKSKYGKATVSYSYNGEPRTQNIMSFANPSVFKKVQELTGQEVEVTLTKNDKGYTEWSAVDTLSARNTAAPAEGSNTVRVPDNRFETREERAQRQVYIIRQSSIANAVALLGPKADTEEVLKTAQTFVDFVFGPEEEEAAS